MAEKKTKTTLKKLVEFFNFQPIKTGPPRSGNKNQSKLLLKLRDADKPKKKKGGQ